YEGGWLGYPTTDEIVLPDGGRRQEFQQGAIYVSFQNAIGSAIQNGPLRDKYNSVGGLTPGSSFLGYLTEDHKRTLPDGQGQMARFQNGVIYWHPTHGAHWVNGRTLTIWSQAGYEGGEYGYPVSDTVPRIGESGSAEQSFTTGSIYISPDQSFQGLVIPASNSADPTFKSYDTGQHPAYDISPDLSEYDVLVDPDGKAAEANRSIAAGTGTAMSTYLNAPNTRLLFDHYYEQTGFDYGVDPNFLYGCLRSETQNFPDEPLPTPTGIIARSNQLETVRLAVAEARRLNSKVKVIVSGPWVRNVASSDGDCVLALGRFTMSSTTAVIASPGQVGQQAWTARQAGHVQDIYDFASNTNEYPTLSQIAVNNAYEGMRLGIAKPFLTYGTSVDYYSQGIR
ncbi:hypothetical protein HQ602_19810, partial [Rhodococcus kroppenstedtii]|uniref:LGFP repeat-containing protein n=1 Tax=Rhodococcoides kroppenstedtii TaxID=293050 RepID=UPI001C9B9502